MIATRIIARDDFAEFSVVTAQIKTVDGSELYERRYFRGIPTAHKTERFDNEEAAAASHKRAVAELDTWAKR